MRVLIIDDDDSMGSAIRAMLSSDACEVTYVESGLLGLRALQQYSFDLAMIDIFMPVMDGLETIRRCLRLAPTMPVVAMSGFRFRCSWGTAPNYLAIACKLGATRYLRKPFSEADLSVAVLGCFAAAQNEREATSPPSYIGARAP